MAEPKHRPSAQHMRDHEAYQAWKKKNSIACVTLLCCMQDDPMCEFEGFETIEHMWVAMKYKFRGTSTTKLRRLTIKFDTYQKHQNCSMRQHLQDTSNMIQKLKTTGIP
ncbi:UBN2 domain-containing protein [Cephalotus follicularis]|uniref:UBN2 domain-containing protein n=1 Tax=Cephalotus follicularis TaxID=3775 RepID=A0A1Q3CG13_CEPFO|nr:UBN2 domain-containing protein [Cephalotus follicularis]